MNIHILYPSWNPTALVELKPTDFAQKKDIETVIIEKYPQIEQVGFIYTNDWIPMLEMVNEELCINAIFSYLYVLKMKIWTDKQEIHLIWPNYWVIWEKKNESYFTLHFPTIYTNQIFSFENYSIVDLPWIRHILSPLPQEDFIKFMDTEISQLKLRTGLLVTGINRLSSVKNEIYLESYIYYHKNNILIPETSCWSGTLAYVANEISKNKTPRKTWWEIRQVSWDILRVEWFLWEDGIHCSISNTVIYENFFIL